MQPDKTKDEFISTLSHEIRTPLTSIKGFSKTMLDNWDKLDDASKKKFLNIILEQSDRLINLVENVLSIAKKANKSIDINKVKELQKKMTKISLPIIFVGVIVLVVGLVLMFILPRKGDTINVYGSIVVIIGAVINAIGVFYYLTAKQLDFDGGILESVDTGKHCPKCGEICSETADYCAARDC